MLSGFASTRSVAASKMACSILQQKIRAAKTATEKAARQREYDAACGKPPRRVVAPVPSPQPAKPKPLVKKPKPKVAVQRKPAVKKKRNATYSPPPFEVTVEGPGRRYPTIQSAINAVAAGGTIWVSQSYISEKNINLSKSVSIIGISDSKIGNFLDIASFIVNGGNVVLKNLIINVNGGTPVSIYGGSLTVQNSSIERKNGTAMSLRGGMLNIDNSTIRSEKGSRISALGNYSLRVTNSFFYGDNHFDIFGQKSGLVEIKNNSFLSNNNMSWLCLEAGSSYTPYSNNVGPNNSKIVKHYYYDPAQNTCYA
jgi:hypothetical protein